SQAPEKGRGLKSDRLSSRKTRAPGREAACAGPAADCEAQSGSRVWRSKSVQGTSQLLFCQRYAFVEFVRKYFSATAVPFAMKYSRTTPNPAPNGAQLSQFGQSLP